LEHLINSQILKKQSSEIMSSADGSCGFPQFDTILSLSGKVGSFRGCRDIYVLAAKADFARIGV